MRSIMANSTSLRPSARARVSVAWLVGTQRMSSFSERVRSASAWMARPAVRPVPRPTIMPGAISATAASASVSSALLSGLKADPLCELEGSPAVDSTRLAAHVCLPRIRPGFTAAAGVFLTPERPADLGAAGAQVHVGEPAVAPGAGGAEESLGLAQIARKDRGGKPL